MFVSGLPEGDQYRYASHAYPIFLIAASASAAWFVRSVALAVRPSMRPRWSEARPFVIRAVATAAVASVLWFSIQTLPYARMNEELRRTDQTVVAAGMRDALFFPRGWLEPRQIGSIVVREAAGSVATVLVPMQAGRAATLTLRIDPGRDTETARVRVVLNGTFLADSSPSQEPS